MWVIPRMWGQGTGDRGPPGDVTISRTCESGTGDREMSQCDIPSVLGHQDWVQLAVTLVEYFVLLRQGFNPRSSVHALVEKRKPCSPTSLVMDLACAGLRHEQGPFEFVMTYDNVEVQERKTR